MSNEGSMIYVVDDDVSVGRALSLLLKSHGFKVETFTKADDFLAFKHPRSNRAWSWTYACPMSMDLWFALWPS